MSRLAQGGLIDRTRQLPFTFDGETLLGLAGDTLASALLANGRHLVGRSFKYHRPRGIMTAGSEEPNALVTIRRGNHAIPNLRATTQELYRALDAQSQNRFPSLDFDLLAVNDLLSPFFGAGFYYKTFMWPRSFWDRLYEPLIRRAAGLGRLGLEPDDRLHDKGFAHCDLLVIGAGPAGLVAALAAGRAGLDVILADEDFLFGGRLNAERIDLDDQPGNEWAAGVVTELRQMENVRLMGRTTVTGAYDGGIYGAVQRVADHLPAIPADVPEQIFWRINARHSILATGAIEQPIIFPGNDRPGVMMAGAVRSYLNRFAVAAGRSVAIFANNDTGHRTAADLQAAGVEVAAVIDTRADATPQGDYPLLRGAQVVATRGRLRLREITVQTGSSRRKLRADCLAVAGVWAPALHLSCHLGARPVWRDDINAFVPAKGGVPGMWAAGAVAGQQTTRDALKSGLAAARAVIAEHGRKTPRIRLPQCSDGPTEGAPFWHVTKGKGRAWVDFQNDVTAKDIAQAHHENFRASEHLKRYTTLGMAPDQGKTANMAALALMAALQHRSIPEVGTTTFRPPYVPVSMAALGAHGAGKGFAPERLMPSDALARKRGAEFVELGLWQRPAWYPRPGETTWRQSCDREVRMVRETVGICDMTTLGKIDVQGPNAAEFLDRIYVNNIATLAVGRTRYGVMLREDGFVMDDGTVARLGKRHFLLTSTTGAHDQVWRHLTFCAQVLWPDLDVQLCDVTEAWAQFAIAGPRARQLLQRLTRADISNDAMPFMSWREVKIGRVAARLFRISYSGELGFELAVPAQYGPSLAEALEECARAEGGDWFGLEALNVLRLEKGFLTHAEIDGRVTLDDLGMGRMMAARDCIGKVMADRPALRAPDRMQLVGLKPAGASKLLLGGAHLFTPGDPVDREHDQGVITSQCFSPHLGHPIALALLRGGRGRIGQQILMHDHLRGVETLCEVCAPVFLDPEGGRMRG